MRSYDFPKPIGVINLAIYGFAGAYRFLTQHYIGVLMAVGAGTVIGWLTIEASTQPEVSDA